MALRSTSTQNDRQAALAEFQSQYQIAPNAEGMIRANSLQWTLALREASLLSVNEDETAALDYDDLEEMTTVTGATVGDIGRVVDATVRGNAIVVLIEDDKGRITKEVVPANGSYVAPREPAHMVAAREQAAQDVRLDALAAELRADFASQMDDLRAEFEQNTAGPAVAEHQEQAAEAVAEAREKAEEQAEEERKAAEKKPSGSSSGGSSSGSEAGSGSDSGQGGTSGGSSGGSGSGSGAKPSGQGGTGGGSRSGGSGGGKPGGGKPSGGKPSGGKAS